MCAPPPAPPQQTGGGRAGNRTPEAFSWGHKVFLQGPVSKCFRLRRPHVSDLSSLGKIQKARGLLLLLLSDLKDEANKTALVESFLCTESQLLLSALTHFILSALRHVLCIQLNRGNEIQTPFKICVYVFISSF